MPGFFSNKSSTISEDAVVYAYCRIKVHNYVLPAATTAPACASAMSFMRRTELKKTRGQTAPPIPNFVNIGQEVHTLKWGPMDKVVTTSLLFGAYGQSCDHKPTFRPQKVMYAMKECYFI